MSNPTTPPESLCILRLSALGDTCHVVPVVRRLQRAWPATRLTWIIGRQEARLMKLLPGVEFITLDKRAGWSAQRELRRQLRGRHFDVLLHLQLSMRANLASLAIPARRRVGFDRARARELQWLFTNERIPARRDQHVLDAFQGFLDAIGVPPAPLQWDLPLPAEACEYADALVPDRRPTLIISPCSSHARRNWRAERYAAFALHAQRVHQMRVILCGGPTAQELAMGERIEQAVREAGGETLVNQIGRDTLPKLLALLARASVLLSPDSGPAHMATLVGTPVIGLYAATRPQRCGPYRSLQWCVDRYDAAARRFYGRPAAQLRWHTKIERDGVMDLIEVAAACERLDALLHPPATIAHA